MGFASKIYSTSIPLIKGAAAWGAHGGGSISSQGVLEGPWSLAAFASGSDLLSPPVLSGELGLWQQLYFYFYWFPLSCSFGGLQDFSN